jgi:death on curing protein
MMHDKIIFLTVDEVIAFHKIQIDESGGSYGIRDRGLLESAVETPKATFQGTYLHNDIYDMASAYMFHIIKNHPFVDGNKRTGTVAAFAFMFANNIEFSFSQDLVFEQAILIATSQLSKENLAKRFRSLIIS